MESPSFFPLSCDGLDFGRAGNDAGIIFCHDYRSPFVFFRADLCIFGFCRDSFAIYGIHSKLFILCVNEMARIAEEENREGADAGDLTGFLSAIKIVRDKQLEPQARAAPTMRFLK